MKNMAENPEVANRGLSAFIDPEKSNAHIVDIMIEERCPTWVKHWSWPVVRPVLYSMLGYRKALRWADEIKTLPSGDACFAYLDKALALRVTTTGLERVPPKGRAVIVSNHPTGLADGSIVLAALKSVRTDVEIMANADACRVNPHFVDVIIPVEWVQEKRTIAKTKETLRR
ncbi:MAG TPA: 1-acyl-sn-glycerol-3-phosphate acyltransferase, partial [Hyphomicrobium sp.]|nr:1-acyl-sn-glycerol-3-phosphate acyltransferase [Hyphomicrobium sp.]